MFNNWRCFHAGIASNSSREQPNCNSKMSKLAGSTAWPAGAPALASSLMPTTISIFAIFSTISVDEGVSGQTCAAFRFSTAVSEFSARVHALQNFDPGLAKLPLAQRESASVM